MSTERFGHYWGGNSWDIYDGETRLDVPEVTALLNSAVFTREEAMAKWGLMPVPEGKIMMWNREWPEEGQIDCIEDDLANNSADVGSVWEYDQAIQAEAVFVLVTKEPSEDQEDYQYEVFSTREQALERGRALGITEGRGWELR